MVLPYKKIEAHMDYPYEPQNIGVLGVATSFKAERHCPCHQLIMWYLLQPV